MHMSSWKDLWSQATRHHFLSTIPNSLRLPREKSVCNEFWNQFVILFQQLGEFARKVAFCSSGFVQQPQNASCTYTKKAWPTDRQADSPTGAWHGHGLAPTKAACRRSVEVLLAKVKDLSPRIATQRLGLVSARARRFTSTIWSVCPNIEEDPWILDLPLEMLVLLCWQCWVAKPNLVVNVVRIVTIVVQIWQILMRLMLSPCPRDCIYTDWTKWSICEPFCKGNQSRSRKRKVEAADGGKPCSKEERQDSGGGSYMVMCDSRRSI